MIAPAYTRAFGSSMRLLGGSDQEPFTQWRAVERYLYLG